MASSLLPERHRHPLGQVEAWSLMLRVALEGGVQIRSDSHGTSLGLITSLQMDAAPHRLSQPTAICHEVSIRGPCLCGDKGVSAALWADCALFLVLLSCVPFSLKIPEFRVSIENETTAWFPTKIVHSILYLNLCPHK